MKKKIRITLLDAKEQPQTEVVIMEDGRFVAGAPCDRWFTGDDLKLLRDFAKFAAPAP